MSHVCELVRLSKKAKVSNEKYAHLCLYFAANVIWQDNFPPPSSINVRNEQSGRNEHTVQTPI